jgi:hypothetical protein
MQASREIQPVERSRARQDQIACDYPQSTGNPAVIPVWNASRNNRLFLLFSSYYLPDNTHFPTAFRPGLSSDGTREK